MKLLLIILINFPLIVSAQTLSSKSSGLGGAGRASVESIDSLYLNPAAIGLLDRYYFGSGYYSGLSNMGAERETFSVTLTDGTQGVMLPGGLAYRYHRVGVGNVSYREHELRGGFGVKLTKRLSAGGSFTNIRSDAPNADSFRQNNIALGLLLGLTPNWGLAVTGEGLIEQDEKLPTELQRASRWGLGTSYQYLKILQLRYDVQSAVHEAVENTGRYSNQVGISLLMRGYFLVNVGFINDDIRGQNWTTGGISWEGPRLKVGYSLQSEDRAGLGVRHFVDLWLNL